MRSEAENIEDGLIPISFAALTEQQGASRWFARPTFSLMFSSFVRHPRLAPCGSVL